MNDLGLVLVGVGLFPYNVAGDKNFFTRLIPLLAKGCRSIDVLSINDGSGSERQELDGCQVTYHNTKRAFHLGDRSRYCCGQGSLLDYHHKHQPAREIAEILLTTLVQLPKLRRLVRNGQVDAIHFMDNMGPSMPLVKRALPGPMVTHSAMAYAPRGRFYDRYLQMSMRALDRIIPYSQAYATRLRDLGIAPGRIEVIRWGVEPREEELGEADRSRVRSAYGVRQDARLLVWSGFIQQIGEADFRAALEVARKVTEARPNCRFIFAFKPKSFRPEFKELASPAIRVETNVERFAELLEAADLFYSPILRLDAIVAPPLTWLEAMSLGTPVITTAAGGVDEVVRPGETGFVARSHHDLADVVTRAVDCTELAEISQNCRRFIAENCDIHAVAERYLTLWREGRSRPAP